MPISRNGKVNSHTTGHRKSASNASGQHKTNKTHHPKKPRNAVIGSFPSFLQLAARMRYKAILQRFCPSFDTSQCKIIKKLF